MSLSASELKLAHDLAADESLRASLLKIAPVAGDLRPLAEAYIGFLSYAPEGTAEMPPALYAFAQAHRATPLLYGAFRAERPDLVKVAEASLSRTHEFFTPGYKDARGTCARHLGVDLDHAIWAWSAEDVFPDTKQAWIMFPTLTVLIGIVLTAAVIDASMTVKFAILALAVIGFIAMSITLTKRQRALKATRLYATPDVLRAGLLRAAKIKSKGGESASGSGAGDDGLNRLAKPFKREQLARKVADVLATKPTLPGDNVVPLTARR
jgi:hypothetical protein